MNIFGDSVSDLRYDRGIVSFRLHAAASPAHGVEIHLPFSEFVKVSNALTRSLHKIEATHVNWLKQQLESPPQQGDPTEKVERVALGKFLASV